MNTTDPMQILLLDNEGQVRAGFRAALKEAVPSARIHEAAGYGQAIAILANARIDFAFLDFNLTGEHEETGLDVLRHTRLHSPDTRVVMLSGYVDKRLVDCCIDAGALGYIPKAMEGDEVLPQALQAVFQGLIYLPKALRDNQVEGRLLAKAPEDFGVNGRLRETLYYVCQGYESKIIADQMGLEEGTVRKDYVSKLLRLFKVKNRTQLVLEVARLGIAVPKPKPRPTPGIDG